MLRNRVSYCQYTLIGDARSEFNGEVMRYIEEILIPWEEEVRNKVLSLMTMKNKVRPVLDF